MLDNNMRVINSESAHLSHEMASLRGKVEENKDKIQKNKVLPYLVANVGEVIDIQKDDTEDNYGAMAQESRTKKAVIVKTTTR